MKEIEYDGITYLYFDSNFVEKDSYIIPTENILKEVTKKYYSQIDYSDYSDDKLRKFIKETKSNLAYDTALEASLLYYERHKQHSREIRYILPVITSLYRKMQRPEEVIRINKEAYDICGKSVFSVPLYTSIAAAYCDLEEYEKARQFCDIAYAEQGGGIGIKTELSLVYQRIEKEIFP